MEAAIPIQRSAETDGDFTEGLKTAKNWPQKNDAPPTRTALCCFAEEATTPDNKKKKSKAPHTSAPASLLVRSQELHFDYREEAVRE